MIITTERFKPTIFWLVLSFFLVFSVYNTRMLFYLERTCTTEDCSDLSTDRQQPATPSQDDSNPTEGSEIEDPLPEEEQETTRDQDMPYQNMIIRNQFNYEFNDDTDSQLIPQGICDPEHNINPKLESNLYYWKRLPADYITDRKKHLNNYIETLPEYQEYSGKGIVMTAGEPHSLKRLKTSVR